ncbi:MAG: DUF362 domain-containing protein [Candidatus Saganbacteria bacterium]|nr:DUF362 domain-containing protein [Candidatus Saganbacteria bacterium]
MAGKVYFAEIAKTKEENLDNLSLLFDEAGFNSLIKKNDLVAVKAHFGEIGNEAYLKPHFAKKVTEKIKEAGGKPFLTDANSLYKGGRNNAVDHIETAYQHGFSFEDVGAPVVISDGLSGRDHVKVPVNLKYFKEVNISSAGYFADSLIAISHFKGHELTGFGGALKNIGMGLGSRSGKQQMHADIRPSVNEDLCTGCQVCIKWCPASAISLTGEGKASIDLDKCIGCAECIASCRFGAIPESYSEGIKLLQEKIAEYASGVLKDKKGKAGFFNFIINVTPNCDCVSYNDAPIIEDIGMLASLDPVAIDQASIDLVNKGKDMFKEIYPYVDWSYQLDYGEKIGLGERAYELIKIK